MKEGAISTSLSLRTTVLDQLQGRVAWDWHLNLTSLDELWEGCQTLTGNELRNHLTLLGALLWVVWGEINRLTFTPDTSIKPTRSLTALICSHIILWTGGRVGGPVILPEATSSDEE
jgi:hypothetical protein